MPWGSCMIVYTQPSRTATFNNGDDLAHFLLSSVTLDEMLRALLVRSYEFISSEALTAQLRTTTEKIVAECVAKKMTP